LLLRALRNEIRPVAARASLPLLLTAFNASTLVDGPFSRLTSQARRAEEQPGVVSASVFLVGSYIDVPEMGSSAVIVADGDSALAEREATALAEAFWAAREEYRVETLTVSEAVRRGRTVDGGPVLLLDTADTTGGGAAGDSVHLLRELLALDVHEQALCSVVDPAAAARCHTAGVGASVSLQLGHSLDPRWGSPLAVVGRVAGLSDGAFRYSGGVYGGTAVSMGPSAVVEIGSIRVLVNSQATYEWGGEQYRALGLIPEQAKFVGVKNMMNFRFAYGDAMKAYYVLDLPGPTPPDMRSLPFTRVQRPIYPLDELHGETAPDVAISRIGTSRGRNSPMAEEGHRGG
jgi:microcystin degradation protein MlrC